MKIVAAAWGTATIYQLDPSDGSTVNSWSVSATPNELAILGTKIYWAGGANVGYVDTASSDTFTRRIRGHRKRGADNLAVFPDGTIVTAVNNSNVKIVAPDGTITTVNIAGFGDDGESVTVLGDNFYALSGKGKIAKISKAGTVLATGTLGEGASGGAAANDGTNVYFGGNTQIHVYDSDLTFVTNWAFANAQAIEFYASGQALVNAAAADLLHIVAADGTSLDSVTMTNPDGTQPFRADTDNESAYAALGSHQIDKLDSGLNVLWTRDVSPDNVSAIAAERITGPTTNEELFQANYAQASAEEALITALVSPAPTQRCIDSQAEWLRRDPKEWTLDVVVPIGEREHFVLLKQFDIKADIPGLRTTRRCVLKRFSARSADPSVPVTCTFTAPSKD